jgi:hypothetical protein
MMVLAHGADAANKADENSPPAGPAAATFEQPMATVQTQAVSALTELGCEIIKELPNYVEGKRVRKIGVFVGSGGETLRVWLAEAGGKTEVRVSTSKTFVGRAGQKDWDSQIVEAITKGLSPAASGEAPAAPVAETTPSTGG